MLRLRVGRTTARAELVRGSKVLWVGEAPFGTPEELGEAVSQLAAQEALPARPAALRVELEASLAQLRTLHDLPPVRTAQLRALVATQAARFFRRNGKPLVTDACWTGREARRQGTALAAAVEEPWLEALTEGARVAGLPVETIGPAELPEGARLMLLPPAERRRRRERALLSVRRLGTVACLTWLAAAGVFIARRQQERADVEREIAGLEQSALAVSEARRAVGEAARMLETLDRAERDRLLLLSRLSAVAAALPESAFLTALVVGLGGRGELSVVARRSAAVLNALDQSRINGSVVRETIARRDWERFTIAFGPDTTR